MESPFMPGPEQQPFLFYNPGPPHNHGQHGHFTPHPHQQLYHAPVHFHPDMMRPMSQPMPQSSHFHHHPSPQQAYGPHAFMYQPGPYAQGQMLTPLASPQPVYPKSSVVIETQAPLQQYACEIEAGPSTPPLSSSSSSVGSPSPRSMVPTPANDQPVMYGFPGTFSGFKQGCENESLTLLSEFDDMASPQLRPVLLESKTPNLLLSTDFEFDPSRLSSRAPSASPKPQSAATESSTDTCDPRQLTVATSSSSEAEAAIEPVKVEAQQPKEHKPTLSQTISNFDFLDSTGLPTLPVELEDSFDSIYPSHSTDNATFLGAKRQRTDLLPVSSKEDSFFSEDSFTDSEDDSLASPWLQTPSEIDSSFCSDMSMVFSHATSVADAEDFQQDNQAADTNDQGETGDDQQDANLDQSGDDGGSAGATSSGRRGRKQSMTDDPSKTFVCALCNRRFRRQEHLKRHYRSLHTQDKPFDCQECGKRFSRSDNLSQHARTHGSGSFPLEVNPEGVQATAGGEQQLADDNHDRMAHMLYEAAKRIGAEPSEHSSSSEGDSSTIGGEKKRKRKRDA